MSQKIERDPLDDIQTFNEMVRFSVRTQARKCATQVILVALLIGLAAACAVVGHLSPALDFVGSGCLLVVVSGMWAWVILKIDRAMFEATQLIDEPLSLAEAAVSAVRSGDRSHDYILRALDTALSNIATEMSRVEMRVFRMDEAQRKYLSPLVRRPTESVVAIESITKRLRDRANEVRQNPSNDAVRTLLQEVEQYNSKLKGMGSKMAAVRLYYLQAIRRILGWATVLAALLFVLALM